MFQLEKPKILMKVKYANLNETITSCSLNSIYPSVCWLSISLEKAQPHALRPLSAGNESGMTNVETEYLDRESARARERERERESKVPVPSFTK